MICPNCGVELENDVQSCFLCGFLLESEEKFKSVSEKETADKIAYVFNTGSPKKKKSSVLLFLIIVVIALILILSIVELLFIINIIR